MKTFRLLTLVRRPIPSSSQRCIPLSTFLTPNSNPRSSNSFDDVVEGGSAVYNHVLKFQRPRTIKWREQLENTASFIGSVTREVQAVHCETSNFGVYTLLNVQPSHNSNSSSFRVLLMMWQDMAEFASKHLKPNDVIYVSGRLGSYSKDDGTGNLRLKYKVIVKELDFVAQRPHYQGDKELECSEDGSCGAGIQNDENRLYLWQVFFANPHDWWDRRKNKLNPKQPDFKHKDTGEALWLSQYDPPWVKRQLQLLDSKIADGELVRPRSCVSTWVYDE